MIVFSPLREAGACSASDERSYTHHISFTDGWRDAIVSGCSPRYYLHGDLRFFSPVGFRVFPFAWVQVWFGSCGVRCGGNHGGKPGVEHLSSFGADAGKEKLPVCHSASFALSHNLLQVSYHISHHTQRPKNKPNLYSHHTTYSTSIVTRKAQESHLLANQRNARTPIREDKR